MPKMNVGSIRIPGETLPPLEGSEGPWETKATPRSMSIAHTCIQIRMSLGWGHSRETPEEAVTGDQSPFGWRKGGGLQGRLLLGSLLQPQAGPLGVEAPGMSRAAALWTVSGTSSASFSDQLVTGGQQCSWDVPGT